MTLILGGTGIVGSTLVLQLLQEKETLSVLYRSEEKKLKLINFLRKKRISEAQISAITFLKGDILDQESLEKAISAAQKVYHCANYVSFDEKDREKLLEVNHIGTQNVVNLCLEFQIEKLLYISSIATIDKEEGEEQITEKQVWDNEKAHTSYEESKNLAEMEVWRASEEGLKVVIVNPGVILNEYDFTQSSGFIFKMYAGNFAFYTSGNAAFVDVIDVAKRMIFLMNSTQEKERYILVSENYDYKDLTTEIRTIYNQSLPKLASRKLLSIGVFLRPILAIFIPNFKTLNAEMADLLNSKTYYNSTKINTIFTEEFIPVKESIATYATEYKNQFV